MTSDEITERLEYLRGEIRAERISMGELIELQGLAEHIEPGDVELLEWAGVPEFPDDGPHATYIKGEITLSDGSTTGFSIQADLGWQQWGNDPSKLGDTVDLMKSLAEATADHLHESEQPDA